MSVLALIHPTDLLAVELRESLDRRRDLWRELRLLSTSEEEVGTLVEVRGAAAMVQGLEEDSLEGVDVVFFSGPIEPSRPLLRALPPAAIAVVLSPDAGPEDGQPLIAGVNLEAAEPGRPLLSPHPGAVALAHLLHPLGSFGPRRAVATLLEPVSTCGKAGLDEMLEQTRGILTFRGSPPAEILPAQLAFNVLPSVGAPTAHMAAHLRAVLQGDLEISIHVLKAGVFHSYGICLHVELAEDPGVEAVVEALAEHPMNDRSPDPELLGPIDAAARDEVLIGPVVPDPARPGAYQVWAVMDNLTCGGARNALAILEAVSAPMTH